MNKQDPLLRNLARLDVADAKVRKALSKIRRHTVMLGNGGSARITQERIQDYRDAARQAIAFTVTAQKILAEL
ncbi:hypothetical protein PQR62_18530 [Herbaspirillum lusitanum]|jgi:hypothetical protein|uniref:Uncharacterized protein n=1 Tax=Herbaspirillum lusitanum TaxID=213312 RepID=A0ABW9AER2_9BURK